MANLNKKIRELMSNRPKYQISGQYQDNIDMSRVRAYGRNRGIMQAEQNIQDLNANNLMAAQQSGASTADILGSLAQSSANTSQNYRDLAYDEANIQDQNMNDLMTANIMMAEERDKEWNYNVNMPYQQQLSYLQQRKQNKNAMWNSIIGGVIDVGAAVATGGASSLGSLGKK